MDNTKEFFDADMERMMGNADATNHYAGKQEPKSFSRGSKSGSGRTRPMTFEDYEPVNEQDKGFYDPEMEQMMGGHAERREEQQHTQKKSAPQGHSHPTSFDDYVGASVGGTGGWTPAIHGDHEVEGFGGWFFRDRDQAGHPVIRLVVEQMTPSEALRADEWYGRLGRMSRNCFLHRTGTSPVRVDGYTVFDFEITNQMHSLGELHRRNKMNAKNPEMILRKLNELIIAYRAELVTNGEQYRALNCLTLNTVFVDADNNLMVLPILYNGRNYPVEIAREAMIPGQKTDERSDLYAAAYVAVEAFSDSDGDKPIRKPESEVILACLQTVREWRPTPTQVKEWLDGKRPDPNTEVGGTPKDKPITMPNPNKLIQTLTGWMGSWKQLEEPEDTDDTDETADPAEGRRADRRKSDDTGDDSWYDC